MTVRVRFAPSPTGYLHIGSARTALFNYLFARHHQGQFILRIEDTDRERSTDEAIHAILAAMDWLGLSYDEGPFYQSEHTKRYQEVAEKLLKENKAYRCYCSKERLEALRNQQLANKEKPRYDGHCRDSAATDNQASFVVRFRNPKEGEVVFEDQVYGEISYKNEELDDLIILRTDGSPTYNFTVVVDDWDMKITHVIRGDDHLNNTPRQINLFNALNAKLPVYAHVPMILDESGKKLSKRHGAASVMQYREQGYLPQAVLNYLVRLGWSSQDKEIFTMEEMIKLFDIKQIQRSPAALNLEKLNWLNQQYLMHLDFEKIKPEILWHAGYLNLNINDGPPLDMLRTVMAPRVNHVNELLEKSTCFYEDQIEYHQAAFTQYIEAAAPQIFKHLYEAFSNLEAWTRENIHKAIQQVAEKNQLKMGKVGMPLRVAVTGGTQSPGIDETVFLIGQNRVLLRLANIQELLRG